MRSFIAAILIAISGNAALAAAIDDRNPVINNGKGLVVGTPAGGNLGVGTGNFASGVFVNGTAVAGGLAVPNANLLGGNGSGFLPITVGSGLNLISGVLTSTGGVTIPSSPLLSGNGSTLLPITLGTNLSITGGVLNASGNGTPGGSPGQLQTNVGGTQFGGIPTGTVGNSVVLQTTSGGTISPGVLPTPTVSTLGGVNSITGTAHQWLSALSNGGAFTQTQPSASDISGLAASATTDTTNAGNISTGTLALSRLSFTIPTASLIGGSGTGFTTVTVGSGLNFSGGTLTATGTSLTVPNSVVVGGNGTTLTSVPSGTTGNSVVLLTGSGGTIASTVLPAPGVSTLGGVQSAAAVTHQWLSSLSTLGVFTLSQPSAADVSGLAASATTDTTNATNITSGTLALARLPFAFPTANLLGGSGTGFTSVAVGSGLNLSGGTLTATGTTLTVPNSVVIGGNGTALTSVASGTTGNSVVLLTTSGGAISASVLPNPSASTLGGVQSKAATGSQWLTSITTSGVPVASQPAFTDISGTVGAAQLPLATIGAFGAVKPDGTTITVSGGVISSSGGVTIPNSGLVGGNGTTLTSVTVGSGLNLSGGTLTATGTTLTVPNSLVIGGNGTTLTSVTALNGLPLGNVTPSTVAATTLGSTGTATIGTASTNHLTLSGSSGNPTIAIAGTGPNSALLLQGLGTSGVNLKSGRGIVLQAADAGTGSTLTNYASIAGTPTGVAPTINFVGTDTYVGGTINTQGNNSTVPGTRGEGTLTLAAPTVIPSYFDSPSAYGGTGTPFTLSGNPATQLPVWYSLVNVNSTGTPVGPGGNNSFAVWDFDIGSSNVNASPVNPLGGGINYFYIGGAADGPATTGSTVGLRTDMTFLAPTANNTAYAGTSAFYGADYPSMRVLTGDNGTGLVPGFNATGGFSNSHVYAFNPFLTLQGPGGGYSGATNWRSAFVTESDMGMDAGSSATYRDNTTFVDLAGDAVQGRVLDTILAFSGNGTGPGRRIGISYAGDPGLWPMDTTKGSMISAPTGADILRAGYQTLRGLNVLAVAFPAFSTSNANGGPLYSAGLAIDGAGTIRQGACYDTASSSGLSIDCNGLIGTGLTIVAPGSGFWPGEFLHDPWSGMMKITDTQVVSAVVTNGGTGGTNGPVTITGFVGTGAVGTPFTATGTITGNALAGALTITNGGDYTQYLHLAQTDPGYADAVTGGGLSGATVQVLMGIKTAQFYQDPNGLTRYPLYPSSTPPSNPVALIADDWSFGTGATAAYTWNTTATTLALSPSGGGTTVGGGLVLGSPTGGNLGAGKINVAGGLYLNGVAVGGGITIPNSCVVGGNGSSLTTVTVGSGLSCSSGTLAATGTTFSIPNSLIIGGNGTVLTSVTAIDGLPIGSTTPSTGKFTTLGSTGLATLGSASANYITVGGSSGNPVVQAAGSSANIAAIIEGTGTGSLVARSGNGITGEMVDGGSGSALANYVVLAGTATGAPPTLTFLGTDANVGGVINTKGTGTLTLGASTTVVGGLVVGSPTGGNEGAGTGNFTGLYVNGVAVGSGGGGTPGGTSGQVQYNNAGSFGGISTGTTGNSVVLQTTSGGTIAPSVLPTPTTITLGGVQSKVAVSNQFLTSISTSGVVSSAQPAFSNLSGSWTVSQFNGGSGASSSTFARGDGTWATPSGSGLTVPNSNLIGGNGTTLTSVTVGSGLAFSGGTLSATGGSGGAAYHGVDVANESGANCDGTIIYSGVHSTATSPVVYADSYTFSSADVGATVSMTIPAPANQNPVGGSGTSYFNGSIVSVSGGQATMNANIGFTTGGTGDSYQYAALRMYHTDNTTPIQAALDTLPHGAVNFPPGVCAAGQLTFHSGNRIIGSSQLPSVVMLKSGANTSLFVSEGYATITAAAVSGQGDPGGVTDFAFQNIQLDGNRGANTGSNPGLYTGVGDGIQVYGAEYTTDNLLVNYFANDGLYSQWSYTAGTPIAQLNGTNLANPTSMEADIHNAKFFGNGGWGIVWQGPHDSTMNTVYFLGNGKGGLLDTGAGSPLATTHMHGYAEWGPDFDLRNQNIWITDFNAEDGILVEAAGGLWFTNGYIGANTSTGNPYAGGLTLGTSGGGVVNGLHVSGVELGAYGSTTSGCLNNVTGNGNADRWVNSAIYCFTGTAYAPANAVNTLGLPLYAGNGTSVIVSTGTSWPFTLTQSSGSLASMSNGGAVRWTLDLNGLVAQTTTYTVSTLPTCNSGTANSWSVVSDAASPTYNGALSGSGAVKIPVFCNGSAWTAH